jgi:hypothetical protein
MKFYTYRVFVKMNENEEDNRIYEEIYGILIQYILYYIYYMCVLVRRKE